MNDLLTLDGRDLDLIPRLREIVPRIVATGSPAAILDARLKSESLRELARKCRLALAAQNECAKARIRLEIALGHEIEKRVRRGRPKNVEPDDIFRLKDHSISRDLSSRAQKLARLPVTDVESYFRAADEADQEITVDGPFGLLAYCESNDDSRPEGGYWLTPPDLYAQLDAEFHFDDFDPCPYPRPPGFDGLVVPWRRINYVNPPFLARDGGPMPFIKKAIEEQQKGNTSVILLSAQSSHVVALAEAGAEIRSPGRVAFLHTHTGKPMPSPPPSVLFVLRGRGDAAPPRGPETRAGVRYIRDSGVGTAQTKRDLARRLVAHFQPSGRVVDPCRGGGAFYDALPSGSDWAEIAMRRDFLEMAGPFDWAMTNPPWNAEAYRGISRHAFRISENVVLLVRLVNAVETYARLNDPREFGHGLCEVVVVPWAEAFVGQSEGFALAACHWKRGWTRGTIWTHWD